MFKKLNTKTLILILVILAGIVVLINYIGKKDRTFSAKVMDFDPGQITAMMVYNPKASETIKLEKGEGGNWTVHSGDKSYKADDPAIMNMLEMLSDMKTERIAATTEDKWEEYHVSEGTGIRVELFQGKDIIANIMIGKFTYKMLEESGRPGQQQQAKMTSYLRHYEEEEVYAVEGIVRMNFTSGLEFFRNKEMVGREPENISRLTFIYPDQRFTLEKTENYWFLDGQPVDSLKTVRYLRSMASGRSSDFIDDIDLSQSTPEMRLMIEGAGFDPIEVSAYPAADSTIAYYVTTTHNPGVVFNGFKGKLVERTFVGKDKFLPKR